MAGPYALQEPFYATLLQKIKNPKTYSKANKKVPLIPVAVEVDAQSAGVFQTDPSKDQLSGLPRRDGVGHWQCPEHA